MKKIEIVKKETEFNNIIATAPKLGNKYFFVFSVTNNLNHSRFGITVGKKLGNAVIRNKYKRKIKSIIDENKFMFQKSVDYIIIVRKACIGTSYIELKENLIKVFQEEKK